MITERAAGESALLALATIWRDLAEQANRDFVQVFVQDLLEARSESTGAAPSGFCLDRRVGVGILLRRDDAWHYGWSGSDELGELAAWLGDVTGRRPHVPRFAAQWPAPAGSHFAENLTLFAEQIRPVEDPAPSRCEITYADELIQRVTGVSDSEGTSIAWGDSGLRRRCFADMRDGNVHRRGFGRWFGGLHHDHAGISRDVRESAVVQVHRAARARSLGARRTPVLLSPAVGAGLLHELLAHGLEADNYHGPSSYLGGRLGSTVAHEELQLSDVPAVSGRYGSMATDDEGISARGADLVTSGTLSGLVHSRRTSLTHGAKVTGSGRRRDFRFPPLPRASNTVVGTGSARADDLHATGPVGLLHVRALGAGNVDTTSGEFTFVANDADFVTPNGDRLPLTDVTISGDALTVLRELSAIGDDQGWDNTTCAKQGQFIGVGSASPSIRFEDVEWRS